MATTRSASPKASTTGSEAAPTAAAKPAGRDAEIAALQKQIDALARGQQGGQDTALPLIEVEAPKEVPIGETARIVGVVGDDGSPPRLKVNGEPATLFRLAEGTKAVAKHSLAFRIDVPSEKEGRQQFVLEACDAAGNCVGDEVVVRVGGLNRPSIEGRNFALVIGNNAYRDLPPLKTARNDARALADLLVERYDFDKENVQLLLDADRNTILGAIEGLRSELDVDDRLVIYYAGHGQIDKSTGEGFWQPVDAAADKTSTWIANDDVRRQLKGLPAKHVLVIADSCFSGSLTRSAPANQPIPEDRYFTEIDSHWSRKVISSGGTEPVADSGSGGHSVFAHYLLKTLGQNDRPYITSSELYGRFVRAVTNNSDQKPEFGTISKAGDEGGGDFTFILRDGG
ncbi:MAG: caspase family protein [Alphaproteobacteria bacterium]|nr:caspase family protein [Alphaproteobacteria bacterium]